MDGLGRPFFRMAWEYKHMWWFFLDTPTLSYSIAGPFTTLSTTFQVTFRSSFWQQQHLSTGTTLLTELQKALGPSGSPSEDLGFAFRQGKPF